MVRLGANALGGEEAERTGKWKWRMRKKIAQKQGEQTM
jgi:hypothetical protein